MNRIETIVALNNEELKTITGGEEPNPGAMPEIQDIPTKDGWKNDY